MKEEFCCNCHWYDGVHGCQGCAECKIKHEIVLWSDCCDHLWLIPERLKIGLKTNADCIRAKSDEGLANWLTINGNCFDYETWLKWLKQEAET